jgi:hypothetical protein
MVSSSIFKVVKAFKSHKINKQSSIWWLLIYF